MIAPSVPYTSWDSTETFDEVQGLTDSGQGVNVVNNDREHRIEEQEWGTIAQNPGELPTPQMWGIDQDCGVAGKTNCGRWQCNLRLRDGVGVL